MGKRSSYYKCDVHLEATTAIETEDLDYVGERASVLRVKGVPCYVTSCGLRIIGFLRNELDGSFRNYPVINSIPTNEIEYEDYLELILKEPK